MTRNLQVCIAVAVMALCAGCKDESARPSGPTTRAEAGDSTAEPEPPQADRSVSLPAMGVECTPPLGWTKGRLSGPEHIGSYHAPGADWGHGPGLSIQAFFRRGRDLADFADQMARRMASKIVDSSQPLDGTPAHWLKSTRDDAGGYRPLRTVVAEKHGVFYSISLFGERAGVADDSFERFVSDLRWVTPQPPSEHLALAAEPVELPGGKLSIRLPEIARPDAEPANPQRTIFFINDYERGGEELVIEVNQLAGMERPAAETSRMFIQSRQRAFGLSEPVAMRDAPQKPDAWTCDFLRREVGAEVRLIRYILWSPAPRQIVMLQFILHGDAADHAPVYDKLMDEVFASMAPIEPPAEESIK